MAHYDSIAPIYDAYRSNSVGIATISDYIETLGWDISVLDMGCGTGKPIAKAIAGRVREYTGVEVSPVMASEFMRAVPRATCLVSDLATLELGTKEFDLCFSWGSLCHLEPENQEAGLNIAISHTKPGGLILFTGWAEEGSCQGHVGPHEVRHHSLGAVAYDELFLSKGCNVQFKGEVENGAAYLFVYQRLAPLDVRDHDPNQDE